MSDPASKCAVLKVKKVLAEYREQYGSQGEYHGVDINKLDRDDLLALCSMLLDVNYELRAQNDRNQD